MLERLRDLVDRHAATIEPLLAVMTAAALCVAGLVALAVFGQ